MMSLFALGTIGLVTSIFATAIGLAKGKVIKTFGLATSSIAVSGMLIVGGLVVDVQNIQDSKSNIVTSENNTTKAQKQTSDSGAVQNNNVMVNGKMQTTTVAVPTQMSTKTDASAKAPEKPATTTPTPGKTETPVKSPTPPTTQTTHGGDVEAPDNQVKAPVSVHYPATPVDNSLTPGNLN